MRTRYLFLLALFLFYGSLQCQILTINDLVSWSRTDADVVGENLVFRGWTEHGYEINKDSGFVRRTWMVQNKYNDLKSYFQYYISDADSLENYTIYQFSDRETFNSYRNDLKRMGYKLQSEKKKRKKKKEKNKYKDKEELYLADKKNSLVSVKEVFLLGFNTFLVSTYDSRSRIAKNILEEEK
jgi:hypothetical protein